jgi:hypothetical protein
VVVEDIPALVCGHCQEPFYDDRTVMVLDQLRSADPARRPPRRELRVPVYGFEAPPAAAEEGAP